MKHALLLFLFLGLSTAVYGQLARANGPELSVFPNPVISYFEVDPGGFQVTNINVYNVAGRSIRNFEFRKEDQYDIADLPTGIYLIQFLDSRSQVIKTKRITKS
ncbi:MAG: T9SS type A sorting domain-containing protein [Saprospiraceae bacterium]